MKATESFDIDWDEEDNIELGQGLVGDLTPIQNKNMNQSNIYEYKQNLILDDENLMQDDPNYFDQAQDYINTKNLNLTNWSTREILKI